MPEPLPVDITLAGVRVHGWLDGVTPGGLFGWKLGRLGEWDLPPFWLRHLLLNLCATPGIERHSLMLSPAGDWQLGPLANAAELLEPWLVAYHSAIREPLPLLPRSSQALPAATASRAAAASRWTAPASAPAKPGSAPSSAPLPPKLKIPGTPWPSATAIRWTSGSKPWPNS